MRAMSHMYYPTNLEEREYSFRDRCSREVTLHENIKLPGKVTPVYMPEVEGFSETPAGFEGSYKLSKSGNAIMVDEKVILKKRIYENDDWDAFKRAVEAQKKFAVEPLILKFN